MSTETTRVVRKALEGTVISNKMDKTIVVEVTRTVRHAKYNKFMKRKSKYTAHDERNEAMNGDVVRIEESRPYSKSKRFRLAAVVERAVEA